MMLKLISTLSMFALLSTLLVGCASDYVVFEAVSASENPAPAADPAVDAGADEADGAADVAEAAGSAAEANAPAAEAATAAEVEDGPNAAASAAADPAPNSSDRVAPGAGVGGADAGLAHAAWSPGRDDTQPAADGAAEPAAAPAPQADPLALRLANAGGPVSIDIPAIGVSAPIEHVGQTPEGAMDAPAGWMSVGWYQQGYLPGLPGNAVVAGHLDNNAGGPAVFWDLGQLTVGDEVTVGYANGDRYTFIVEDWKVYDHNATGPIIDSIFGKSQTADLNLVTCDGVWDHGAATYAKRLVVFTTLEPEKTVLAGEGGFIE